MSRSPRLPGRASEVKRDWTPSEPAATFPRRGVLRRRILRLRGGLDRRVDIDAFNLGGGKTPDQQHRQERVRRRQKMGFESVIDFGRVRRRRRLGPDRRRRADSREAEAAAKQSPQFAITEPGPGNSACRCSR